MSKDDEGLREDTSGDEETARVSKMNMYPYLSIYRMYPVLTMKNAVGQFDGKHYWLFGEKEMTCIDQQFMDEFHDNGCSNFGKWPTVPPNCSADRPGDPHVNHQDPRREQAEIALFVWRVKNAVIRQTKKDGKAVDVARILEREHRNFPFELDMGPDRLLRYMQPCLDNIIDDAESVDDTDSDDDSLWDICTDAAADKFEMLLKQVDGPYGAGKKGK